MRETIEKVVRLLVYCTFFVPLVVVPTSFIFPFIVPKIIMFRTVTVCMAAGYALLLYSNWKEYGPKFTPLNNALAVFLLSFAISTFVGIDAYHSFWDNHERMLGLFTIAHYIGYYFILTSVFKNWSDWKIASRIFLLAGSLVMMIGLIQVVNPTYLLNGGSARVASTLGNSIYVGAYGLFLFFLSSLLFLRENNILWKWISVATAFAALLGIVYSGTRGSVLGLAAGVFVGMLLYIFFLKEHVTARKVLGGIVLFGMALCVVLYINRESAFVTSMPAVSRVFGTTLESVENSPRALAWRAAVESWKEKPIFGWGPNNFYYAFNKYYDPRALEHGYGETWFDNAHNIVLNTLTVQGLVGVISYLAIFVAGIIMLARAYKQGKISIHLFAVGSAFLVAHLIQNITVFENPTSYLYFMFWLAMVNRLSQVAEAVEEGKAAKPTRTTTGLQVGVAAIGALLVNLIFNLSPALANMRTLATIQAMGANPIAALPIIKETLNESSPHIDDIRNDISRQLVDLVSGNYQKLGVENSMQLLSVADEASQKNLILHPHDIRVHLLLAQLDQVALQITNKAQFLTASEDYSERALAESPKRQQVIFSLANVKLQLGKNDEAIALLQGALNDDQKIPEIYWRLMVALRIGNYDDKVKEIYELAKKNNIIFRPEEQQIIDRVMAYIPPVTATPKKAKK